MTKHPSLAPKIKLLVLVAGLGYFVDVFDLLMFGIVRVASLKDLGFSGVDLLHHGIELLNWQMGGILTGGIFWGILGDKKGRVSTLFGSILIYSAANLANGFVSSLEAYSICRFIAGFGLAGELGAAITLVSEVLPISKRGLGTTFVASLGLSGSVVAALVSYYVSWRTCYMIGGALGFLLLFLRFQVRESSIFRETKAKRIQRGQFFALFSGSRAIRYFALILVGLPVWCSMGILITFSPEIGEYLKIEGPLSAATAIQTSYVGIVLGDVATGLLSQRLKSRKKVLLIFLSILTILIGIYFNFNGQTSRAFYALCALIGFATGYWAIFVTIAAENFGTNLRSTVATTAPNFVRGGVIPLTLLYQYLSQSMGLLNAAAVVCAICLSLAFMSLFGIEETFSRNLDFVEKT